MAPVLQSRRTDPHTGLTIAIVDSLGNLARRLRRALGRTRFERQLDAELRFHVDAECAELVQRGLLSSVLLDQVAQVHAASRIVDDPERHGFKANPQRFDQTLTREIQRVMGTVGLQP